MKITKYHNQPDKLNIYKKKYKFYKKKYLQSGFGVTVTTPSGDEYKYDLDFSKRQSILILKDYLLKQGGVDIDNILLYDLHNQSGVPLDNNETVLDNGNYLLIKLIPFNVEITSFYLSSQLDKFTQTKINYPNLRNTNTKISEIKDELTNKTKIINNDFDLYKLNIDKEKLEMLRTNTKLKSIFGDEDDTDTVKKLDLFIIPNKIWATVNDKQRYKEATIVFYLRDKSISKEIILKACSDIEKILIKKVEIKKLFNIEKTDSLAEVFSNDDLRETLLDELRKATLQCQEAYVGIQNSQNSQNNSLGFQRFEELNRKQTLINIDLMGIFNLPDNNYERCLGSICSDIVCNLRIDMNPKQGNLLNIEQIYLYLNKKRELFTQDEIQKFEKGINLTYLMHNYGKFINPEGWHYMAMTMFTENLLSSDYKQWDTILMEYPDLIELSIILIKLKWLTTDIFDSNDIPPSTKDKIKELFSITSDDSVDILRESLILPVSQLIQYLPNIKYNLPEELREQVKIIGSNNRYYNYAINYAIHNYLKKF